MFNPFPSLARRRVLDLSDRWGQFAGKLLAQLGADVVIGEPLDGHVLRRAWPRAVLADDEIVSLYFWHFNAGKRSAQWDFSSDNGLQCCRNLANAADIILCGRASYNELRDRFPDIVDRKTIVVVTPYGLANDLEGRDDDLHVASSSGFAGLSGYGDDEKSSPLMPPAEQPMHSAGLYAAIAALLGVRSGRDGSGTVFDVSAQAAAFQGTEMAFAYGEYRSELLRRRTGGYATPWVSGRWQRTTADGAYAYTFGLPSTQRMWTALRAWMRAEGRIEDLDDPEFERVETLRGRTNHDITPQGWHANDVIGRFVESLDAETVYRKGQEIGLPWARIYLPEETLGDPQHAARSLFHRTGWPGHEETYLTQTLPWVVHGLTGSHVGEVLCPPVAAAHTAEVLAEWTTDPITPGAQ